MKIKKILALSLNVMMCLTSVACSSTDNAKEKYTKDKNQIVYASTKDIRDINPHLYSGEMAAQNMVFESLVKNTDEGVEPWLAKNWDISEDGKEYTFYLREDVEFTDGAKFNADAVKQNFDAIIENIDRHNWLDLVNEIKDTVVVDEYTFKLVLEHAYYPTLVELALTRPFRFISPNCFVDGSTKDGVNGYIGTGPWVLSEHKDDQYAIFTTNENYYGEKPKTESVKWTVMTDHQTILMALEKGEIDLIFGSDGDMIDLDSFKALEKSGKYETKMSDPVASRAILLNSNQEITGDVKVREALQYAVNKEAISEGILNGSESVADTLMAKTVPFCDLDLEIRSYNIDKANGILEDAGWIIGTDGYRYKDGKKCSLDLYYNADNAQEGNISAYLQSDLKAVGVELNVIGEEKQSFLDRQKSGEFDLQYSLSWGTPYDPQSYVSSFRIPAHGDYQAQLGLEKKEWLDKTITDLMIETDEIVRSKMYSDVFTYIHEQGVYIPLTYSRTKAVHIPNLKGVDFNPSQYEIPFDLMYFEN